MQNAYFSYSLGLITALSILFFQQIPFFLLCTPVNDLSMAKLVDD